LINEFIVQDKIVTQSQHLFDAAMTYNDPSGSIRSQ